MRRKSLKESLVVSVIVLIVLAVTLWQAEVYTLMNLTTLFSLAVLALSLALVWGYGGIVSYGNTAFFGIGCYAYAIAGINFGDTTWAIPVAIAMPCVAAAIVGYFVFYGRLSPVFVSVITLSVSLILFKLIGSTAGHHYKIGDVPLGGFNGISNTPLLNWPFDPASTLSPEQLFVVAGLSMLACYLFCKWLLTTRFGRAVVAVRENEIRAELLGYDARRLQLGIFMVGAAIAGVAGILYANSVYVSPNVFGLSMMAQSLIWVVVGGLGTLVGPALACIAISWLTASLGAGAVIDPNIPLGLILILFVRFVPNGLLPTLEKLITTSARSSGSENSSGKVGVTSSLIEKTP